MRIEHYIPHPRYKITVFRSGHRYVVKFDDADHDLSFKLREGEVSSIRDIERWVDEELLLQVKAIFDGLSHLRIDRYRDTAIDSTEII